MEKCMLKVVIKTTNQFFGNEIIMYNLNWNIDQITDCLLKMYSIDLTNTNDVKIVYKKLYDLTKNVFQYLKHKNGLIICLVCDPNINYFSNNVVNNYFYIDTYVHVSHQTFNSDNDLNMLLKKLMFTHQSNYWQYIKQFNKNEITWIEKFYKNYLFYYQHLFFQEQFQLLNYKLQINLCNFNRNILFMNNIEGQQTILNYNNLNIQNNENNNVHNLNDNVGGDVALRNNRDWLDDFYLLSRVIILFIIVYFYSSPLRFIIVTFLGFLIYLYHVGFFRTHPNMQIENNQLLQNDNQTPILQRPVQNRLTNESGFQNEVQHNNNNNNENNERRPGLLLFSWMIFSSFLTSLVPDQPHNT